MNKTHLIEKLKHARGDIDPDQEIEITLFRPKDALGISLCYFEIYGENFPLDHVYDPDEVMSRKSSGDQYTVVARTPKGEIVGLIGIFRYAPNPDIYELGQLMVLKSFRDKKSPTEISKQLILEIKNVYNSRKIPVISGEAVCNHTVTQRLVKEELDFTVTGLALELMPSKTYLKEQSGTSNISLLFVYNIRKDQPHRVFLPEVYKEVILKIYKELGLERETGTGCELSNITKADIFSHPEAGFTRLTVHKSGEDFIKVIEDARLLLGKEVLMQVYLNLGDESAPAAVGHLREMGYFFGGIQPLWLGTDVLLMQKLPKEPVWEDIKLYDDAALHLTEYIRQDYNEVSAPAVLKHK